MQKERALETVPGVSILVKIIILKFTALSLCENGCTVSMHFHPS
jgi:hypothetical protein